MNIIGGDGSGGYARTKPGKSIVAYQSKRKEIKLHKKASATAHRFESQVLNRVVETIFAPCLPGVDKHKQCARIVVQEEASTLPRVCSCTCHVKKSRRRLPTIELVGSGLKLADEHNAVGQHYINDGKDLLVEKYQGPVAIYGDLKELAAAHASDLARGKQIADGKRKDEAPILGKQFMVGRRRMTIKIVQVWA